MMGHVQPAHGNGACRASSNSSALPNKVSRSINMPLQLQRVPSSTRGCPTSQSCAGARSQAACSSRLPLAGQGPHMLLTAHAPTAPTQSQQQWGALTPIQQQQHTQQHTQQYTQRHQQLQQQQQDRQWQLEQQQQLDSQQQQLRPCSEWDLGLQHISKDVQQQQQQWQDNTDQRLAEDKGQVLPAQHQQQQAVQHAVSTVKDSTNGNGRTTAVDASSTQVKSSSNSSSSRGQRGRQSSAALDRNISSCIKQCSTWQQVDAVVREYGPAFNIIHISAAITHLAQLSQHTAQPGAAARQQQQQQQQQLRGHGPLSDEQQVTGLHLITSQMEQQHMQLRQGLHGLQQHHTDIQPTHSSSNGSSGSSAALQMQQQQELVSRLLQQAGPKMQSAGARQVANILWGLATLQHPCCENSSSSSSSRAPDMACVELLLERACEVFRGAEPQHLSNMALAVAKLQLPVSQDWLQQLMDAWLQLPQQQQQHVDSRCRVLEGGAVSSQAVAVGQGEEYSVVSSTSNSSVNNRQLGVNAVQKQVAGVGAAEQAARSAGPTVHSSSSSSSSGSHAAAAASVSPQATCNLLWSLVQLQQQPSHSWLQAVVAAAAPHLLTWPAKSVAMFVWACGRVGYRGDSSSSSSSSSDSSQAGQQSAVDRMCAAVLHHAGAFSVRDLAQALWGAAVMGLTWSDTDLQQLLATAQRHRVGRDLGLQQQQGHEGPRSQAGASSWRPAAAAAVRHRVYTEAGHNQQQQQRVPPRGDVAHSVSMVLWALPHLRSPSARTSLPPAVLQPWLWALSTHAPAAPGQSLGVAAWALGQLGLTATAPQLVQRVVQTAARRQHMQPMQQRQQDAAGGAAGNSSSSSSSSSGLEVCGGTLAALVWSAARCVLHARQQQQRQAHARPALLAGQEQLQQRDRQQLAALSALQAGRPGASSAAYGVMTQPPAAAAAAAAVVGPHRSPPGPGGLQASVKAAAGALVSQQGLLLLPQLSLWQLSLVLWSTAALQLNLPAGWATQHLPHLQTLLLQQQQQQQSDSTLQQQRGCAASLAMCVWALGRCRLLLPAHLMQLLQELSLGHLQQQQQQQQQGNVLSREGLVLLLLGFTRLATTAGCQLPRRSQAHSSQLLRRHRALRHTHRQEGQGATRRQQQQQQQQGLHVQQQEAQEVQATCSSSSSSSSSSPGTMQGAGSSVVLEQQQQQTGARKAVRRCNYWQRQQQTRRRKAARRRLKWQQQQQQHGWVGAAGLQTSWLQAYCVAACPAVSTMDARSLVAVLWALGRLRFHPGSAFMAAVQHRTGQLLPGLRSSHIALLLWALARLNTVPKAQLLGALVQDWETQLAYASMADEQQYEWAQRQLALLQQLQQDQQSMAAGC